MIRAAALATLLVTLMTLPARAESLLRDLTEVGGAELTAPTTRYDHGVLGDAVEWGALSVTVYDCNICARVFTTEVTFTLPPHRVFEDVAVRLADLDGDRQKEIVVVETDIAFGASLAVYNEDGRRAATPFIGQPNRWLAPAGIADFDGDGRVEIAYVDRPHLVRELVFVRLEGDQLVEIARAPGFTNHRIGDTSIAGGVRACPDGSYVILASADWARAIAVGLKGTVVQAVDLGPISGPADLAAYTACPD